MANGRELYTEMNKRVINRYMRRKLIKLIILTAVD